MCRTQLLTLRDKAGPHHRSEISMPSVRGSEVGSYSSPVSASFAPRARLVSTVPMPEFLGAVG
jgi:hypothetical protein